MENKNKIEIKQVLKTKKRLIFRGDCQNIEDKLYEIGSKAMGFCKVEKLDDKNYLIHPAMILFNPIKIEINFIN